LASNIKEVTREIWNADDADIQYQLWHIMLVSEFPPLEGRTIHFYFIVMCIMLNINVLKRR